MKPVRKAVIPAAGLGTRVLPASKSIPKEMLNIVDKPAIQYIVEEAAAAGIEDILIVTNRGKEAIENHFDRAYELEDQLERKEKADLLEAVQSVSGLANIYFLRQKETKGLGHAVLCARTFVGDEPFAVLYGDDVIVSRTPVTRQLIDVYQEFGCACVGVGEVPLELIGRYCSLKVEPVRPRVMRCSDMVEKPRPDQVFSPYAILGRCVLEPDIFDVLERIPRGAGGEYQLTDAMCEIARNKGMIAVEFEGRRYDLGSKLGILKANVELALEHPELKDEFLPYLKTLLEEK
ncbi:MAG: UTP--glucose-1-phosphate uridylyltransferase GalU [Clostridiales bacterium]|nr:UTP--glucose-1-phosphate uridylyltransferase GalU [Clostridiales bacterium]